MEWVEELMKQLGINDETQESEKPKEIELSEDNLNRIADNVIKKLSSPDFDVETGKPKEKKPESPNNEEGEDE